MPCSRVRGASAGTVVVVWSSQSFTTSDSPADADLPQVRYGGGQESEHDRCGEPIEDDPR